mgnify:CR=1 FL=1
MNRSRLVVLVTVRVAQDIDPALTLRKMAPEAGRVGGDMMRSLLRAVDANAERREGGK